MTPEQQALYDKLIEESRQTAEGGFGNLYQSTGLLPARPAPPMPSRMDAIATPPQDAYATRAPGPYGNGSPPMPQAAPLPPTTVRRPLPMDSMGQPPLMPADRPEVAAMWARGETPPPASLRRSPPPSGGAGGGPIVERGGFAGRGSDIGMIADIFPGFFRNISKRRNEERAQQSEHNSRMAQLAFQAEQERAQQGDARADKAPGEARAAQQFAWEREDRERERGGREAASKAEAEKMDYTSPASERRRAAFRATNPELAVWMDKHDPGALARVAAGDEQTWDMIEERAKRSKRAGMGAAGAGRGRTMGGGPGYAAALAAIEADDIPGALKAADDMAAAGDRKGAAEIRKLAAQSVMAGRRSDEVGARAVAGAERKRGEADRKAAVPGWIRAADAPEVSATEAAGLRDGVAALESIRDIAKRMRNLTANMSPADRAAAAAGKDTAATAEALQLQRLTTTKLRQIAHMGVPSAAEMAVVNEQAPEARTLAGLMNQNERYQGLVNALELDTNAFMRVRGYSKDAPRPRTISKDGESSSRPLTEAQAEKLRAQGFEVSDG